jgi:hypothetical protein
MTASTSVPHSFWDQVEPDDEGGRAGGEAPHSCYSKQLKADLPPGTFVLIGVSTAEDDVRDRSDVVARIVKAVGGHGSSSLLLVEVNIFEGILHVVGEREGIFVPQRIVGNNLRHVPEIVQTTELRVVAMTDITNLAFVFTEASLADASNLYYTCQGMANAFLLRYRVDPRREEDSNCQDDTRATNYVSAFFIKMPMEHCLPFPSCYENSKYHDCFARRIWNNIVLVKLEIMKLLGRYSQQQGLFGRECARLYLTAETWGYICLQCSDVLHTCDFGSSTRFRVHRMVESGLVVKAARVQKSCTVMRFSTKTELQGLCRVLGEAVTAGQRCRLPKSSEPKSLWINDVINVVCGSDAREPGFIARTPCDGIDFEYDGLCELFITVRYSRYAYSRNTSLLGIAGGCDPLLFSLISRCNPYKMQRSNGDDGDEGDHLNASASSSTDDNSETAILFESEFEDGEGRLYRVTTIDAMHVMAICIYPKKNNAMFGYVKSFGLALAKELIQQRLTG